MSSNNEFALLQQAHAQIASRLSRFFDSEDFQQYRFVVNEFELFTLFLTSAAWLRVEPEDEKRQLALIEFHKSHLVAMVDRILAGQVEEVEDGKAETLMEMVQNIAETRLRDYFSLMQKSVSQDPHLFFTALGDAFLEKFIHYEDPQLLTLFVALLSELFQDIVELMAERPQDS